MRYHKVQNGYILRLEQGEKLIQTFRDFLKKENIPSCTIQAIGSVINPTLAYYELSTKKFMEKEFKGAFELLSCIGSVGFENAEPLIHVHASISDENFKVIGGHVMEMVAHATIEVYLFSLDQRLKKSYNNETGLKLFDLDCEFSN